mgnify:FL=1
MPNAVKAIFAPTPEALATEMNKLQGQPRAGRIDPSLSGVKILDTTEDRLSGIGGHGTGSYSAFARSLGVSEAPVAFQPLSGELSDRESAVFQGKQVTSRPTDVTALGTAPAPVSEPEYVSAGGAFFQNTPSGLAAVNDLSVLRSLVTGQIQVKDIGSVAGYKVSTGVATPALVPGGAAGQTPVAGVQPAPTATPTVVTPPPVTGVSTPPPVTGVSTTAPTGATAAPSVPPSQAPGIVETYTQSILGDVEKRRVEVESSYQRQIDTITKQQEQTQARMDALTKKTEGMIKEDVEPLLAPFRADLEKNERERLKVEENFFANQNLVSELDSLLTDIQASIQREKNVTGLAVIRDPRVAKVKEDAMARIGVIEAVMASRNNQISVANNLIDRSLSAMNADRSDKLNYYNTLLNFYGAQKDEAGKKLLTLNADQKQFLSAQINLLETDLANSQKNAEYIKSLMMSPEHASFLAKAGVTLNDSPAQISSKMEAQAERDKVEAFKNEMTGQGYAFVPFPQPGEAVQTFTVGGQALSFKAPTTVSEAKGAEPNGAPVFIITDPSTGEEREGTALDAAKAIIAANSPNTGEATLVNAIRENVVDSEGKPLINVGDAQRLVRAAKEKATEIDIESSYASALNALEGTSGDVWWEKVWKGIKGFFTKEPERRVVETIKL